MTKLVEVCKYLNIKIYFENSLSLLFSNESLVWNEKLRIFDRF